MGMEDQASGQLRAYLGTKSKRGNAFQRAGLTNGANFVIDAVKAPRTQSRTLSSSA
jgi:hypothetical protein